MEKIISLFQRNYDGDHQVRDEVVPGAEWVTTGEGVATVKIDGTSCLIRDGKLFKRYDAKPGRTPPPDFEQSGEPDPITGRVQGWMPVGDGPEDKYHREAWWNLTNPDSPVQRRSVENGTYELVGPKVQGNSGGMSTHHLIRHGAKRLYAVPRDFVGIAAYLEQAPIEGIVWHHPDGRMVKIKARDFGITWPR